MGFFSKIVKKQVGNMKREAQIKKQIKKAEYNKKVEAEKKKYKGYGLDDADLDFYAERRVKKTQNKEKLDKLLTSSDSGKKKTTGKKTHKNTTKRKKGSSKKTQKKSNDPTDLNIEWDRLI